MRKKNKKDIIYSMMKSATLSAFIAEVVGVLAVIIDGIVTSRFYGEEAYSGVSLLGPYAAFSFIPIYSIAIGTAALCAERVGKGQKKEVSKLFSLGLVIGFILVVILAALSLIFCYYIIQICGIKISDSPVIYQSMKDYLFGYVPGLPVYAIAISISEILILDNDKKVLYASTIALCVSDIIFDLLNALVFNGGTFGIGLATSLSFVVQLIIVLFHFRKKERIIRFSLKGIPWKETSCIFKESSTSLVRRIVSVLRDVVLSRLNLAVAFATSAIVAKGVQNDINKFAFCISTGVLHAVIPLTKMYFGAKDRQGIRRIYINTYKTVALFAGLMMLVLCVTAYPIARLYSNDSQTVGVICFAVTVTAFMIVFDTWGLALQGFCQGVNQRRIGKFLIFADRFVLPIPIALIMAALWGSYGVIASVLVSKILLILIYYIVIIVKIRRIPKCIDDFLLLPVQYGGSTADNVYFRVTDAKETIDASNKVIDMCLSHGVSKKKSSLLGLFVEEVCMETVNNAALLNKKKTIDMRLYIGDEDMCLTFRDFGKNYNPTDYCELIESDDMISHVGMRIVMQMADDVEFISALNSNCCIIRIKKE